MSCPMQTGWDTLLMDLQWPSAFAAALRLEAKVCLQWAGNHEKSFTWYR